MNTLRPKELLEYLVNNKVKHYQTYKEYKMTSADGYLCQLDWWKKIHYSFSNTYELDKVIREPSERVFNVADHVVEKKGFVWILMSLIY
jgi:hypothetical protein